MTSAEQITLVGAGIGIVASFAGTVTGALGALVLMRRDKREKQAEDDREADRLLKLKDGRIDELTREVESLKLREESRECERVKERADTQNALNLMREKIAEVEAKVDAYGCWDGPTCPNRRPLSGPKPGSNDI